MVGAGIAPEIKHDGWFCTADLSAYVFKIRALDLVVKHAYNVDLSKKTRNYMKGKTWEDAVREGKDKELLDYARRDALWCWKLWNDFQGQWPEHERNIARLTMEQGKKGILVDTEKLEPWIKAIEAKLWEAEKNLPWVEAGKKPTSSKALAEQCNKVGIPCPPPKVDDEEGYIIWESTWKDKYPWVMSISDHRSVSKVLATLKTIRDRIRPDGTVECPTKFFGAHCFTGDHEVLTPEGWVRLSDWRGGTIMQWNGENLLWGGASANKFEVTNGERLLHLNTGHVECLATQGHWFATFDLKTGKQRREQAEFIKTKRRKIPISAPFSDGHLNLPKWKVQLLAAVQADGHYMKDCRAIRFRFSRQRKIKRLREILAQSELVWDERIWPSEPGVTVIHIRQFPPWLEGRKKWTSELLTWSQESLAWLRDELVHWDGTQSGPNSVCYMTDFDNASWMATIAHLTGYAASVSFKEHPEEGWNTSYLVSIRPSNKTEIRPHQWSDAGAASTVYCPTSELGACLFRYNAKIFISHQTGRWSGEGGINFQNFPKEPMDCGDGISVDLRSLFLPRPGKKMIICDLAQIEPRVLNWIAGNEVLLNGIRSGLSYYEAYSRLYKNWKGAPGTLKKELGDFRYTKLKNEALGLGYQMGWKRYIDYQKVQGGVVVTEEEAKETVNNFRANNPFIADKQSGLWAKMQTALLQSIGQDFETTLPSGRVMKYGAVRRTPCMKENDEGKMVPSCSITAVIGQQGRLQRKHFYGGKIVQNGVQATARDVFAYHWIEINEAGHDILFSSHDEAVLEVEPDVTPRDIQQLMSRTPEWLEGCPISAEAAEAPHYKK